MGDADLTIAADVSATPAPADPVTGVPTGVSAASASPTPLANGLMARRFRGFLPVVIDVETGGFHSTTDALLEIAAVLIDITPDVEFRKPSLTESPV